MESTYLDRQAVQELFAGAEQGESPQWRGLPAYKGRRRFSVLRQALFAPLVLTLRSVATKGLSSVRED